jgi:transcriptional antiterminator RfaH
MRTFFSTWYLIYTRPRQENRVIQRLTENGIDFFYPTMAAIRTWHDRKKSIVVPLFPSYVFVYLKSMSDFYSISQTDGVVCFVRFGKEIATVKPCIINTLRLLTGSGKEIEVREDHFNPGQKLVILKGALKGMQCEVIEYNHQQMVLVRVQLLNRAVLAKISNDCFKAVQEREQKKDIAAKVG